MANTIILLKKAGSSGAVPSALANGELGIDHFTGNLWFKAANSSYKLINPAGGGGGNSYGTANVNGTLLVAGVPGDILTIIPGTNITLDAFSANDTIRINSTASGGSGTSNPSSAFLVNKNATNQNFTTATATKLTWGAEEYDVGSEFTSNTFTPVSAGKYTINCTVRVTAMGTGTTNMKLHLYKNGSLYKTLSQISVISGLTDITIAGDLVIDALANDTYDTYIEFVGLAAGTATVSGAVADSWFAAVREAGATGTLFYSGNTTINFGTGNNEAQSVVTGQTGILTTGKVLGFIVGDDTTSNHTANDHKYIGLLMSITAGEIVANTGFTIYGRSLHKLNGQFNIRYRWYN